MNIRRAQALARDGRMQPAGAKAFEAKREERFGVYSYEQRPKELVEPYAGMLTSNARAQAFFESQAPSYRRTATWWVVSAKKEETRTARAKQLVSLCAKSQMIPGLVRKPTPKATPTPSEEEVTLRLTRGGTLRQAHPDTQAEWDRSASPASLRDTRGCRPRMLNRTAR